ncbi:MAG: regulatory iron-sulfur-containing complex subunit RicT [Bacteroidales bacterium]|nr:regulatory iron-sulfur-containing complex subunit RicT [Bacteroidales bacterium]
MSDYIENTRGHFNPVSDSGENSPVQCPCARGRFEVFDWLGDISDPSVQKDLVEVRFKNNRKAYFLNVNNLDLNNGDLVAVEASPGHDIGTVTLRGELVYHQLKRYGIQTPVEEFKKVYRKVKQSDLEKFLQAVELEEQTMLRTRKISESLNLNMKISDVEYQGDKTKAIFYYIADDRVDFRELIKILAEEFKLRIEMKQIGARQEAGRIGGIGSCGRELCCSTWMTNFVSVTTSAARYQEVSLNPQKLAGQCGKLKCCLNYELKCYMDAQKDFPDVSKCLETDKGPLFHFKTDIHRRLMWFSSSKDYVSDMLVLSVDKVKTAVALNKAGKKAVGLQGETLSEKAEPVDYYKNAVDEDSLTRFQEAKPKKKKRKNNKRKDRSDDTKK